MQADHSTRKGALSIASFGATAEEWNRFATTLDLESDLLPVVMDPHAKISEKSKLRDLGKTPSRFDQAGTVVGIPQWTSHITTDSDIRRWSADSRVGICVVARRVKAIDIDIADPVRAAAIESFIETGLGKLPTRRRANSGKCLLAFQLPVAFPKRVIKTAHGIIELLSEKQQFVAAGTHPSGARIQWDEDSSARMPDVTMAELDCLWQALIDVFALPDGASTERRGMPLTKPRNMEDTQDSRVAFLEANGWVTAYERDGKVHVRCPWEEGHSTNTGPTSTSYFPAGVGGYAQGHFKCLHASCATRTEGDFDDATGFITADFNVVEVDQESLPALPRDRMGRLKPERNSLVTVLEHSDSTGARLRLRLDSFTEEEMLTDTHTGEWRRFKDVDYSRLCQRLERGEGGFRHIPKELIREVVAEISDRQCFDSAKDRLRRLEWDGVQRVDAFLADYVGAADNAYTRAVSRYLWTALAGRVMQPGVKADMVPVLVGPQGSGKSSIAKAIAPSEEQFLELDLSKNDDDLCREMRGKLVVELGEMKGLRAKEVGALKSFITRSTDVWVRKYREFATQYARRSVFIGTSNDKGCLPDDTEHRRWLPVDVPARAPSARNAAVDALDANRDQLWAEGAAMFNAGGIAWADAEALARVEHAAFEARELWLDPIRDWLEELDLDDLPRKRSLVKVAAVLAGALGKPISAATMLDQKRVANALRKLGFREEKRSINGKRMSGWWLTGEMPEAA